jgi:hypothetical protein
MTDDKDKTNPAPTEFDFSSFPENTLFHDRRGGRDRRKPGTIANGTASEPKQTNRPKPERRERKERRKRIDPTTFEKQYSDDEMEFMNAMQRFKERTGKSFPTYGEVLKVAVTIGYRRLVEDDQLVASDDIDVCRSPIFNPKIINAD